MFIVICTLIGLAVLVITNLFSFAVGRCARKLPVIDGLPWVMHRSAVPPPDHGARPGGSAPSSASRPRRSQAPRRPDRAHASPQQPAIRRLSCTAPSPNRRSAMTGPTSGWQGDYRHDRYQSRMPACTPGRPAPAGTRGSRRIPRPGRGRPCGPGIRKRWAGDDARGSHGPPPPRGRLCHWHAMHAPATGGPDAR